MLNPMHELEKYIHHISSDENSTSFYMKDETGEGQMTFYQVFSGIYIIYNDFHMENSKASYQPSKEMFCIDHCREGRIEWPMGKERYIYIEEGDMLIHDQSNHCQNFEFPFKHYHGITIAFEMDEAKKSLENVMDGVVVDIVKIKEKFCEGNQYFIMRATKQIEHIFSELYHIPKHIRLSYFKIKVIEMLLFLEMLEVTEMEEKCQYVDKMQAEKVHAIVALVTKNMDRWYTLDELSTRFDFPKTSMKQCFKGVYGMTIAAYMKDYRMNAAAMMLKNTDESIMNIASKVGYGNASKFATAFYSVTGMSPSEYRKSVV